MDEDDNDNLHTEFTFTDCNNGSFKAEGKATRSGTDNLNGSTKCIDNYGETLIKVDFSLERNFSQKNN